MKIALPVDLERSRLRFIQRDDHNAYVGLESDPEAKRFVGGESKKCATQIKKDLEQDRRDGELIAIADLQTDAYIGRCGVIPTGFDGEVEIYCILATAHQRKRIGSEIFRYLAYSASQTGLVPIALVDPENCASRSVLEKMGFHCCGPIKFTGSYQDGHLRYELKPAEPDI